MKTQVQAVKKFEAKGVFISELQNGEVILPPDLLKKLQEYVEGEIIYVPKRDKKRSGWGELCGTKMIILKRNQEIYEGYKNGAKISELALSYYLSEDSIKKIVRYARNYESYL